PEYVQVGENPGRSPFSYGGIAHPLTRNPMLFERRNHLLVRLGRLASDDSGDGRYPAAAFSNQADPPAKPGWSRLHLPDLVPSQDKVDPRLTDDQPLGNIHQAASFTRQLSIGVLNPASIGYIAVNSDRPSSRFRIPGVGMLSRSVPGQPQ